MPISEVRRGEPGHLVVREVPRHDAQQHAERRPADDRGALAEDVDRLILHDLLGVVGVVLGDVGREVDLADRGRQRLAHLAHDDRAQLVAALAVQFGDAADQRRAIGDAGGARPARGRGIRRRERLLELGIRREGVGGQGLARGGIDDCVVTHGFSVRWLSICRSRAGRRRLAGASSESVSPRKKAGRLIACQIMMTIPRPMIDDAEDEHEPETADVDPLP